MPKFIDHTGEIHTTNQGHPIKIISCTSTINCDIQFIDGTLILNRTYRDIKLGRIKKPVDRVGNKHSNFEGYEMEIISGTHVCTIKFNDWNNTILENISFGNIKKGAVSNPYHPSVCGVGFRGIGSYKTTSFMSTHWRNMIKRCSKEGYITYELVKICEEWKCFQNFAEWFHKNYNPETMQGWQLDKDILVKGNKIYSPTTCCLVPAEVNSLFLKTNSKRGKYPIGVTKSGKKFTAKLNKNGDPCHLGSYNTVEEAFQAYKTAKEEYIKEVANKWRGKITERCYWAIMNYEVDIND